MVTRQSDPSIVELADRRSDDLDVVLTWAIRHPFAYKAGGGARLTIGEAMP
jgi:hypothetical protein